MSDGVIVSLDTIALEISTIACLQAIVFLKEIKKMISICIFDTFTFAKAKV